MTRSLLPADRRGFGRRQTFIHAIAKPQGRGGEACVVRNFSDGGALIAFAPGYEVPSRFRLTVEEKGLDVLCEVRRREGVEVGVQFLDGGEAGIRLLYDELSQPEAPPATVARVVAPALRGTLVTVVPGETMRRIVAP